MNNLSTSREQSDLHQLYYFAACPYCIVVRLALWWYRVKIPLKDILLHPSNCTELIDGGGKSQVPCLRIESADGNVRWMYESADIIRYVRSQISGQ
jgi:glutaredoxin 2